MDKSKVTTPSGPVEFILPEDGNRDALIAHIQQDTTCEIDPARRMTRTYYDTFDWRLYQADLHLYRDKSRQLSRYVLESGSSGRCVAMLDTKASPVFAWDMAPGPLRDKISPLLEMRALLPLINIQREIIQIRVLNKSLKTVAQLSWEHNSVRRSAASTQKIEDFRVRVIPMRGFRKAAQDITRVLAQYPEAVPAQENLYDLAMRSLCLVPGEYNSKLDIQLNAQDRADHALQLILKNLYHTLQANEAGLEANIDSEFLHDYRVTVRRTRSALSQVKHVLPQKEVDRFKTEFSWLGNITTLPRDLDVHLLNFDKYADSLPEDMRGDLEPLRDYLHERCTQAYENLKKELHSARYRRLRTSWSQFLDSDLSTYNTAEYAEKPIEWVAKKYTWRVYKRVLKQGDALEPASPAVQFHELRKTCKKLRYLMEFFACLFPKNEIKSLIRTLKLLQENLGDFQDLEVHAQSMREFGEQMMEQAQASSNTLMAMGALAENLERNKMEVHQKFSGVYKIFRGKKNQDMFALLFNPEEEIPEPVL